MKDIDLQAFEKWWSAQETGLGTAHKFTAWNAWLARAAVEADRAQRVPDGFALVPIEPTPEMLNCGLVPTNEGEKFAADIAAGYRKTIWAAMLASTPAQPAQQEPPPRKLSAVDLAKAAAKEQFRHYHEVMAAAQHQEPPQPVERKPMTDEQAVKCIEAAGFRTWTSAHFRLVKEAERHHGIKE